MVHSCEALVVACIDFRFQEETERFCRETVGTKFDRVGVAGTVKDLNFLLTQIGISVKLHGIKKVYLLIHEDCGAYKEAGAKQHEDLLWTIEEIKRNFGLAVEGYLMRLEGGWEKIEILVALPATSDPF